MCGIIGILSDQPAAPRLVEALKRLEYRGYDSAGIALLEGGKLERLRAPGKLANLDAKVRERPLQAGVGIGHRQGTGSGEAGIFRHRPRARTDHSSVVGTVDGERHRRGRPIDT